jgi:hypothetical protein
MRKRDVAVVLLSCFGLFLSLENEGSISYRKAWCGPAGSGPSDRWFWRCPPATARLHRCRIRTGRQVQRCWVHRSVRHITVPATPHHMCRRWSPLTSAPNAETLQVPLHDAVGQRAGRV